MSIYKVDTESIIALSRLLHVGANAVDQTMRQSAAPALRKIVFQRGADVFATAQRLADALRRMNTLKNDLNIMGDALKVVAEEAYNSDGSVFALFQGIPVCVATNQMCIRDRCPSVQTASEFRLRFPESFAGRLLFSAL